MYLNGTLIVITVSVLYFIVAILCCITAFMVITI